VIFTPEESDALTSLCRAKLAAQALSWHFSTKDMVGLRAAGGNT
jgi:hypothetical protein